MPTSKNDINHLSDKEIAKRSERSHFLAPTSASADSRKTSRLPASSRPSSSPTTSPRWRASRSPSASSPPARSPAISSGKGAAAALYAALVGGLLRSLARRKRGPADLLQHLNQSLAERKAQAQYATLLALLWDDRTQRLTMANAGGNPPIICRGEELLKPETSGVPVGPLDDRHCDETVAQLQPGDLIVLASDGIKDAFKADGVEYVRERLGEALRRHSQDPVNEIVNHLFAQFDDQTIVILRVR